MTTNTTKPVRAALGASDRTLSIKEIDALAWVTAHLEGYMPEDIFDTLNDIVIAAEDSIFSNRAPNRAVASWKMDRLGRLVRSCQLTDEMTGWLATLNSDVALIGGGES